jgi:uncharacterized membrane protein
MSDHTDRLHRAAARRLLIFAVVEVVATLVAYPLIGLRLAILLGFDLAALVFIVMCRRLLRLTSAQIVAAHARADEDNRWAMLAVSVLVSGAILVAVASELTGGSLPNVEKFPLIIGTILLSWTFANLVYALHYAHMHYGTGKGCDNKGLEFPGTPEPNYWDFIYFSFTNGMAFATSDVNIHSSAIRRVVTGHCMVAFIFNIGVIGFTINLLAGMHG